MFEQCTSLTEITIPSTVKNLPNDVFQDCTSLEKVILPEGLERIGERAFAKCGNLLEVIIPENVLRIEKGAFLQCYNLKKVVFEGAAPNAKFDMEEPIFGGVVAEIYYPANDLTWDEDIIEDLKYGNKQLTWIPYEVN